MALARTPRHKWIDEGLRALAAGGPDTVHIESLARTLGVSKGGFYGYFASQRALLTEMLDTWERRSTDDVIERVEREGGDPMAKARMAGALTFSDELLPIDLAVRHWARREPTVAERLRRVDNFRMDFLRSQLGTVCADEDELEARCLIAFSVAIAAPLIAADHGSRTCADVREVIRRQLFAAAPSAN